MFIRMQKQCQGTNQSVSWADLLEVLRLDEQQVAEAVQCIEQRRDKRWPQLVHALAVLVHITDHTHCSCNTEPSLLLIAFEWTGYFFVLCKLGKDPIHHTKCRGKSVKLFTYREGSESLALWKTTFCSGLLHSLPIHWKWRASSVVSCVDGNETFEDY